MPKRRKEDDDDQLEYISWKIKKLEKKLSRRRHSRHRKNKHRSRSRDSTSSEEHDDVPVEDLLGPFKDRAGSPDAELLRAFHDLTGPPEADTLGHQDIEDPPPHIVIDNDSTVASAAIPMVAEATNETGVADNDLLEILGMDPSATVNHGKDIHGELASRLQHIATSGITKEARNELNEKFLIPENCLKIGAPTMNPEIKAAVPETIMKRDKGIEARQQQLGAAISGLSELLNAELVSKEKDGTRLKQMMDVCRILCDIQHSESLIRRNFAIYSIRKDLKEHLINTKIDQNLFGEDLAETLRSAKAVSKSGSELKTKPPPEPKPSTSSTSNLNWRSPAPAYRQPYAGSGRAAVPPPPPLPPQALGPAGRLHSSRSVMHASSPRPPRYPPRQPHRR